MNPEFIKVIAFAAEKHKTQRRNDADSSPYIIIQSHWLASSKE